MKYKQVVNVNTGVVNNVTEDRYAYLLKTGDYQAFKSPAKEEKEEAPKRKRRTKAEIEADKAKE